MRRLGRVSLDRPIRVTCIAPDLTTNAEGVLGTTPGCTIYVDSSSEMDPILLFWWLVGEHDPYTFKKFDDIPMGYMDTTWYGVE